MPVTGIAAASTKAHIGRLSRHQSGRRRRVLGVGAARRHSEHLVAVGERVRAGGLDDPRDVAAQNLGQGSLGDPAPILRVDRVYRCGVGPDQHLAFARLGPVHLLESKDIGIAGLVNHDGLHGGLALATTRLGG